MILKVMHLRLYCLQRLKLDDNYASGEIPEEIGVLQELKELDFRRNKISGDYFIYVLLY